jgi:hypothetical protein
MVGDASIRPPRYGSDCGGALAARLSEDDSRREPKLERWAAVVAALAWGLLRVGTRSSCHSRSPSLDFLVEPFGNCPRSPQGRPNHPLHVRGRSRGSRRPFAAVMSWSCPKQPVIRSVAVATGALPVSCTHAELDTRDPLELDGLRGLSDVVVGDCVVVRSQDVLAWSERVERRSHAGGPWYPPSNLFRPRCFLGTRPP